MNYRQRIVAVSNTVYQFFFLTIDIYIVNCSIDSLVYDIG
jgi:hypothetical protein